MSLSIENLKDLLSQQKNYVNQDDSLNITYLHKLAQECDQTLLEILLDNDKTRNAFFFKQKSYHVFIRDKFIDFITHKDFLANSYTRYKNKIGLSGTNGFLKKQNDVVLNFPFKDCILEGGQSKDEEKRNEIYFNTVLAGKEIDQLLSKKVLSKVQKITQTGLSPLQKFTRDASINEKRNLPANTITDNLIIKGNNLIALHSIKSEFHEKVKLIYIDPPYNTGNDSFHYNDNFNHSTWLLFMKNRLEVAKDLLKEDGVIFVQCDDNEQAYLKVLMDEVFGRENFIGQIIWKKRSGTNDSKTNFSSNHDYINIYFRNQENALIGQQKSFSNYTNPDNDPRGKWTSGDLTCNKTSIERPNLFYPITDPKTGITYECNQNRVWRTTKEKMLKIIEEGKVIFPKNENGTPTYKRHLTEVKSDKQPVSSLFLNDNLNQTATKEIYNLFDSKVFTTPKPEQLLKKILEISTEPNDIVLDYHLGSGTTCAVAHKMGRQYIGIEQMNYVETIAVQRMQKVLQGEQGGISPSVKWQGGGEFVYMELKKYNQDFVEKITEANSTEQLLQIKQNILKKAFVDYRLNIEKIQQSTEDFAKLKLNEQKQILFEFLDQNQLYHSYSEIEDTNSPISPEEIQISHDFYNKTSF